MSAETLRRASGEMREYAVRGIAWDGDYAADKGWLAPPVALAVADWLDHEACASEEYTKRGYNFPAARLKKSMAVARAYLGESA